MYKNGMLGSSFGDYSRSVLPNTAATAHVTRTEMWYTCDRHSRLQDLMQRVGIVLTIFYTNYRLK